jgi:hypothetical protein
MHRIIARHGHSRFRGRVIGGQMRAAAYRFVQFGTSSPPRVPSGGCLRLRRARRPFNGRLIAASLNTRDIPLRGTRAKSLVIDLPILRLANEFAVCDETGALTRLAKRTNEETKQRSFQPFQPKSEKRKHALALRGNFAKSRPSYTSSMFRTGHRLD